MFHLLGLILLGGSGFTMQWGGAVWVACVPVELSTPCSVPASKSRISGQSLQDG